MQFPLSFWDINLWLGVVASILLFTAELISPRYGKTRLIIEKRRLRAVALAFGILSLLTAFIRIFLIVLS